MPEQRCSCGAIINRVGGCSLCGRVSIVPVNNDPENKRRRIEGRMKRSPELVEKIWKFIER
jgi:hypothetical protein